MKAPTPTQLTDEQIDEAYDAARSAFKSHMSKVRGQQVMPSDGFDWHFARSIEAVRDQQWQEMLAKQEPVAWMTHESKHRLKNGGNSKGSVPVHKNPSHTSCIPLYTHPPARVPLTDEELRMISKQQDPVVVLHHNVLAFAHAIIAAYEAKNGIGGGK